MGIQPKDIILLVLGFAFGIPASIIATFLFGQPLTILAGFRSIRLLSKIRSRISRDGVFDGDWSQNWEVESSNFLPVNPGPLKIFRFFNLIAAETSMTSASGTGYDVRVVAVLDRNTITGKWMDPAPHGYYGSCQFRLSNLREGAKGRWLGFSDDGTIKTGAWLWTRYN
jgi:hypothetical protein